jgi:hypothetical protein
VSGGCDLDVQNPNAPDAPRAFADPAGLEQLIGGAFRTWVETRGGYDIMSLNMMADNYTAAWNNAAIRFYSSVDSDCPLRCGWTNSSTAPEAAGGPAVEWMWYGYNTVLSSANDVLKGIADGVCFDADCTTDATLTNRNEATAKMLQGMAFAGIALYYDQGFIVDETTDLSNPTGIEFKTRQEMRDVALQKFDEAHTIASTTGPWLTDGGWMGVGNGTVYNNVSIQKIVRTMQAELLGYFPRNATENDQAPWSQIATLASQGISNPPPGFNFEFYIDPGARECGIDCVKSWGNSVGTVRIDTRLASMLATNHQHPWPEVAGGNPCPTVSADKRVGDGTWGPADNFNGYQTKAATANAGTDFACSPIAIFPPARGQYHQSELFHIRYGYLGHFSWGETLPEFDGTGQDPFYSTATNDLLWAEGLIRGGGSRAQAAELINNTRVGRGGLPALTGSESEAELLSALQYEQEVELMAIGTTPFLNRRRIDGLIGGTPRHMPVPAKELDVLVREVYTFGGVGKPDMAVVANGGSAARKDYVRIRSVGEIWADYQAMARARAKRRR